MPEDSLTSFYFSTYRSIALHARTATDVINSVTRRIFNAKWLYYCACL